VEHYSDLLNNVSPQVLQVAKSYQNGRGGDKSPFGGFDFTEGWFRNSGLYNLKPDYQLKVMKWFVESKRRKTNDQVKRVPAQQMIHPTQKPEAVITELLEASAQPHDTVCDPFMGSGSTIKAVKEFGLDLKYIGIELDRERFDKAAAYIGG